MKFVEREFPAMQPRFERLYRQKYPPDSYRSPIGMMVRLLQQRYGLTKRGDSPPKEPNEATTMEPEQVGFAW
jgi:hypothetical protein